MSVQSAQLRLDLTIAFRQNRQTAYNVTPGECSPGRLSNQVDNVSQSVGESRQTPSMVAEDAVIRQPQALTMPQIALVAW